MYIVQDDITKNKFSRLIIKIYGAFIFLNGIILNYIILKLID